ncbi:hypothetical protein BKA70DRAFT_1307792 [Coprinopsis sp. MPI-PUGE-AT-0042]|nr:hypothetical protein BKA70DRAFT_1307792 [Coprinopsis sp. MPI-PUGE-AT-0042]
MVAITGKSFLLIAAAIIGAAPFTSAQRLYDDGSLSLRDFDDYYSGLSARSFERLSIREYIDEQIDLALREYDDVFDELTARHTEQKIREEVQKWEREVARTRPLLKPAVDKEKAARKNKAKDPKAHQKAKNELDTIRGSLEGYEENLSYWKGQRPSPAPGSAPGSPGKGKKK